jgi:hypothetical protein
MKRDLAHQAGGKGFEGPNRPDECQSIFAFPETPRATADSTTNRPKPFRDEAKTCGPPLSVHVSLKS